jgi:hypothetical protein
VNVNAAPWVAPNGENAIGSYPAGSPANSRFTYGSSDGVQPAWFGGDANSVSSLGNAFAGGSYDPSASGGGLGSILSQLSNVVQQYISKLGGSLLGTSSSPASATPATQPTTRANGSAAFQNVSLASTGDPHLSVSGTTLNADGSTSAVNSKFDSMTGHTDLFSTRDFGDGFRVGTTVTAPSASGVTQNASATATMNGGRDSVSMTNDGTVSVTSGGSAVSLSAGQSITLSGGETVSEAANGAVTIAEGANGKSLSTTFTNNGGGGVDVTAQGSGVRLGGDLITGGATPVATARQSIPMI